MCWTITSLRGVFSRCPIYDSRASPVGDRCRSGRWSRDPSASTSGLRSFVDGGLEAVDLRALSGGRVDGGEHGNVPHEAREFAGDRRVDLVAVHTSGAGVASVIGMKRRAGSIPSPASPRERVRATLAGAGWACDMKPASQDGSPHLNPLPRVMRERRAVTPSCTRCCPAPIPTATSEPNRPAAADARERCAPQSRGVRHLARFALESVSIGARHERR